jgi:hypothetical protein
MIGGGLVEMIRDPRAMLEDVRSWRIRRAANRALKSRTVDFFLGSDPVTEEEVREQAEALLEAIMRLLQLTKEGNLAAHSPG